MDKLINGLINNCPYLLRIQIKQNETLRKDTEKWLEKVIETVKKDANASKR